MAILQQPLPRIYRPKVERTFGRQALRSPRKMRSVDTQAAQTASVLTCIILAAMLVIYISGHARMTGVNYQRVHILQEMRALQHRDQLIHTELIKQRDKEIVEQWAIQHGMVRADARALVLNGKGR